LVVACGLTQVFILSAGWGLVRADYLLPYYDITFAYTKPAHLHRYKRRLEDDNYDDFFQFDGGEVGPIVCFVTSDYLPLFQKLTDPLRCEKVVFFAATESPTASQWRTIRYPRKFTNWHYECAKEFMAGKFSI
jgi:hypothetical protein